MVWQYPSRIGGETSNPPAFLPAPQKKTPTLNGALSIALLSLAYSFELQKIYK